MRLLIHDAHFSLDPYDPLSAREVPSPLFIAFIGHQPGRRASLSRASSSSASEEKQSKKTKVHVGSIESAEPDLNFISATTLEASRQPVSE